MEKKLDERGGDEAARQRQEAEARLKAAVWNIGKRLELPSLPPPPDSLLGPARPMSEADRRALWECQQDLKLLRERYNFAVKVLWRTSAVVVGLATPLLGTATIQLVVKLLGG